MFYANGYRGGGYIHSFVFLGSNKIAFHDR